MAGDLAAAWRAGEAIYTAQGSLLYAALSRAGAEDPAIMELSAVGLDAAKPVHLFIAAHYLLLGGIEHPLARYFATIADPPAPPDEAWPHFRAFCFEDAAALQSLMRERPIQMTYVERCRTLAPALAYVGQQAGQPLNLIELGCSAGVMLVFDKYAYELKPGQWIGPADATIRLRGALHDGPLLPLPEIGKRTGIDLNLIDPRCEDDRRWMRATCFPELLTEQHHLTEAMDIVAATDIAWLEGDALTHIEAALAETSDPVCVYHSACLFYWPEPARDALDAKLVAVSRGRVIHRIGIEPTDRFRNWQAGGGDKALAGGGAGEDHARQAARISGAITHTVYADGRATTRDIACTTPDFGTVWWLTS